MAPPNNSFQVEQLVNSQLGSWNATTLDRLLVVNPNTQSVTTFSNDFDLASYILGVDITRGQVYRMEVNEFYSKNLTGTCPESVRASYPNLVSVQQNQSTGCFRLNPLDPRLTGLNVRTHPSAYGTVLGGLNNSMHGAEYFYYDTHTGVDGLTWYQIAPEGLCVDGYSMWVSDVDNYLNFSCNNPNSAVMITQLGDSNTQNPAPDFKFEPPNAGTSSFPLSLSSPPLVSEVENTLTYILSCESGYDLNQAQEIAYVIRSRMISDQFPNTALGVVQQLNQFECWGNPGGVSNYANVVQQGTNPAALRVVNTIRAEVVPELIALPEGGLGDLSFNPFEDKIRYALFTLGTNTNNLSQGSSANTAITALLNSGQFNCDKTQNELEDVFIAVSGPNAAGFSTFYFADENECTNAIP